MMSQPLRTGTGDLVLGSAAPGLGEDDDGHDGPDAGGGDLVVQGEEVGVAPFGGQQRPGVVDDGGHQLAACCGSSSRSPGSSEELAGALAGVRGQGAVLCFVVGHQVAGGSAACGVLGRRRGLSRWRLRRARPNRLALSGGRGLDRLLDLGGVPRSIASARSCPMLADGRNSFLPSKGLVEAG